jgi:hypothetical protein
MTRHSTTLDRWVVRRVVRQAVRSTPFGLFAFLFAGVRHACYLIETTMGCAVQVVRKLVRSEFAAKRTNSGVSYTLPVRFAATPATEPSRRERGRAPS